MPARLLEITATYCHQRFRFENPTGDVIVGEASMDCGNGKPSRVAIKGPVDDDDGPDIHQTYRFYGYWTEYRNKRTGETEKQFQYKTFIRSQPHSQAGIIKYLGKAPGIGHAFASQLWRKFKGDAVRVLRENPDVASAAVDRLSFEAAAKASRWLEKEKALEDCTIEMMDLLDGRGFRQTVAKDAVKEWGNHAAMIIRANPYKLMRFRGAGFKLTDAMYLDLGLPPARLKRQALCAWHTVASNSSGDTWHYSGVVEAGLKGSVGGANVQVDKALRLASRGGLLARVWTDGMEGGPTWDGTLEWVAEESKASAEQRVAKFVAEALREGGRP